MARLRKIPEEGYTPRQAKIELGPLSTAHECEDALRLIAKAVANGRDPKGCLQAASNIVIRLLWSTYQRKRLEIAGLNMRSDDGASIHITRTDYRQPYQEAQAANKAKDEEIEALKAQIATTEGKPRPRPPRPPLN
jgi:hypothetical protein